MKNLLEQIQEHPEVAGSCYLPLNASIIVHLFKSFGFEIPTSQYGLFEQFILTLIYCHHLLSSSKDSRPKAGL